MSIPGFINLGVELCYLYNQITIYIHCKEITCDLQDHEIYNKSQLDKTPLHTQQSPKYSLKCSNQGTQVIKQECQTNKGEQHGNQSDEEEIEHKDFEQIGDQRDQNSKNPNRNNVQNKNIKQNEEQIKKIILQDLNETHSKIIQSGINSNEEKTDQSFIIKYKRGINTFQNVLLLYSLVAFIESIQARICVNSANSDVSFPSIIPLFLLNIIFSFCIYIIFGYFLIFVIRKTKYIKNNRLYIFKFFTTLYFINMPFLLYNKIEERVKYDSIAIVLSYGFILLGLYMSTKKKLKIINQLYVLKIWE